MNKKIYISNLYDYYKILLTEKQQRYFEDYYFHDLTLTELSENYKISRSGIHKQIKEVENKLLLYEGHLQLYDKNERLKKIVAKVPDVKIKKEILKIIEE